MKSISTLFLLGILFLPSFIYAQIPPNQPEQDCISALPICQSVFIQTNSYQGEGLNPNEINSITSCLLTGERNDTWYIFNTQTAGNIAFTLTPVNPTDDFDWAVYNLTNANCSDIYTNPALEVSCNYSGTPGATGPNGGLGGTNPFNPVIPVNTGETYVVNISNFTGSITGYTLDFSASTAVIADTIPPMMEEPTVICNSDSIYVSFNQEVICSSVDSTDFTLTGPGGPYTITQVIGASCQLGGSSENEFIITTTPPIPQQGTFTLSLVDTVLDQCGNVASFNAKSFQGSITDSIISLSSCNSYTSPSGNYIWMTSGTFMDTIANANAKGCDSLLVINLTINNNSVSVINPIVCDSFTVPSGDTTYMFSGIYADTILNASGCDSIITINLTVNESTTSIINPIVCDSFPVPSGDTTYTNSGIYADTILNAVGCDSIITINLTVNQNSFSTIDPTILGSFTVPSGDTTYTTSGTYSDTIPNLAGCDSIITINLTIVLPAMISQSGDTLFANTTGVNYQWLDCNSNYSPINDAKDEYYVLDKSGTYSVEITKNTFIDTASCFEAIKTGLIENSFGELLNVYPNPTTGLFLIDLGKEYEEISVSISDIRGKLILNREYDRVEKLDLDIPGTPGLYFVKIVSANGESAILKILKE